MTALDECRSALGDPNVRAFLRVIRAGETGQTDDAYRMMFGGSLFDNFDRHPDMIHTVGVLKSTAAGAYQFLTRTWAECQAALGLPDFSPPMQDLAAVFLIRRRGALPDVLVGRIEVAIAKCCREWASLPGSPYGQPVRTMAQALATYAQYGGLLDTSPKRVEETPETEHVEPTQPPKAKPMLPIIAALLPSLIEAIPKLGALFGSGSEVATRNVKAAEVAFSIAKDALGATNEQQVVERLKADPVAVETVAKAIEDNWYTLTEAGGGGIDGARKADAAVIASGETVWKSPSFVMGCLLLPLVYLIVGNVTGLYGVEWAPEARAGIAGSLAGGIVMGLIGYYFGQTTSRNRSAPAS